MAALFGSHAQAYQALSAQAAAFHSQFVQVVHTGAGHYALTEATNAFPLQARDRACSTRSMRPPRRSWDDR